jgi:CheY-like chemotaxis protein
MKSILLVEDDLALRAALMEGLGDEGYDVTEAGNGQQALDALGTMRPDIVLTDLSMPEMDGIELISRLHKEYARQFCIIAMTGGIGAAEAARPDYVLLKAADALGATHTIEKPFRLTALLDLLAGVDMP